jgi:hypothetical protein
MLESAPPYRPNGVRTASQMKAGVEVFMLLIGAPGE